MRLKLSLTICKKEAPNSSGSVSDLHAKYRNSTFNGESRTHGSGCPFIPNSYLPCSSVHLPPVTERHNHLQFQLECAIFDIWQRIFITAAENFKISIELCQVYRELLINFTLFGLSIVDGVKNRIEDGEREQFDGCAATNVRENREK